MLFLILTKNGKILIFYIKKIYNKKNKKTETLSWNKLSGNNEYLISYKKKKYYKIIENNYQKLKNKISKLIIR